MAPKRFFTGSTSFSILSASIVSARMLPMTKAPKAELKPTAVEIHAIRQHRPKATMTIVSSVISRRVCRKNVGTMKRPTTNHSTRKKPIFNTESSICPPLGSLPLAIADSITIMTMMSTLITSEAKPC